METKAKVDKIIKVVYFDQESASDYLDIATGGNLSTTKEQIRERAAGAHSEVEGRLSAKLSWLPFIGSSVDLGAGAEASIGGESILSKTLSNTILTDYLLAMEEQDVKIESLEGFRVYAVPRSMAFLKMFSPYMIAARNPEADFDIARMDEALERAKGYYELVGVNDESKVVLRFNIRAFRNNYGLSDLSRMTLVFQGVKVGETTESSLNIESELTQGAADTLKLADAVPELKNQDQRDNIDVTLPVYDVILAGVEGAASKAEK